MSNPESENSPEEYLTPDDFDNGDVTADDLLAMNGHTDGDGDKYIKNESFGKPDVNPPKEKKYRPDHPKTRRGYID